ncbi:MAG: hypothetical protein ACI4XK_02530 [Bacilli bacterium]
MNKEELSNAISDYQKLCRGNYGTILDEIERKQNELNIILKSIEFAKKTSATQEEINDLLEQAKVLQSEIDKLWRQKNKMAKKYIAIRELLSNAAVSKIQRASSEEVASAKKLEREELEYTLEEKGNELKNLEEELYHLEHTSSLDKESQEKLDSYQKRIKDIENRVVYENAKMSDAMCKEVLECRTHIKNILEQDAHLHKAYINSNSQSLKEEIESLKEEIEELQRKIGILIYQSEENYRKYLISMVQVSPIKKNYIQLTNDYSELKLKCQDISEKFKPQLETYLEELKSLIAKVKEPNVISTTDIYTLMKDYPYYKGDIIILEKMSPMIYNANGILLDYQSILNYVTNNNDSKKFIYTELEQNGMLDIPFNKETWESLFQTTIDENTITYLEKTSNLYTRLSSKTFQSDTDNQTIKKYLNSYKDAIDKLYRKLMYKRFINHGELTATIADYKTLDSYQNYIQKYLEFLDNKIKSYQSLLEALSNMEKKGNEELNDIYLSIENKKNIIEKLLDSIKVDDIKITADVEENTEDKPISIGFESVNTSLHEPVGEPIFLPSEDTTLEPQILEKPFNTTESAKKQESVVEQPKVNDATMQQLFDPFGLNSSLEEQKLDNIDTGITEPVSSEAPVVDDNSLNQEPKAPKFTAKDLGITDVQVPDINHVDNGIVDIKPDEEVISADNSITKSSLKNSNDESLDDKAKVVEVAPAPKDIKAMLNLGNNVTPKEPVMPEPIPGAPESPSTFLNKEEPVQTLEPKEEDAPIFVIPNEVTAISNPNETLTAQTDENIQTNNNGLSL